MTATDELRRLLDERGVEWGAEESELDHVTTWNANGGQAMFYESKTTNPNLLQVNYYDLTPVQAVEATMGRGTCKMLDGRYGYPFVCSECGAEFNADVIHGDVNYCPNCGRRIEVVA